MSLLVKRKKTPQPNLENYFPNVKRLRSAVRRIFDDKTNVLEKNSQETDKLSTSSSATFDLIDDFCIFDNIPIEILEIVFDFVDCQSLSRFALSSNACRLSVYNYIKTKRFIVRIQNDVNVKLTDNYSLRLTNEYFKRLAFVFKRCTMILPTQERIACGRILFNKIDDYILEKEENTRRWGYFWHFLLKGWEVTECSKAYRCVTFSGRSSVARQLSIFFNNCPGKFPDVERRLRLFYRSFVLDYLFVHNRNDLGFWIATILGDLSIYHQAKLLYLIFGPIYENGKIDWNRMTSTTVPSRVADEFFTKFCLCLEYLGSSSMGKHTNETISSLVEEITSFPDGWVLENFGSLLLYCNETIAVNILSSRAINGRIEEVSYLFHTMVVQVSRSPRSTPHLFRIISNVIAELSESSRFLLIRTFTKQLCQRLGELHAMPMTLAVREQMLAHERFQGLVLLVALGGSGGY